jgi:hypothetical protein
VEKIIIDNLEVWPDDVESMNWNEAIEVIKELGGGWRLPTLGEFTNTLYPNKKKIFGPDDQFNGNWYRTSTPGGSTNTHWVFALDDGYSNYFHDTHLFPIRLVRDFTGETALDYLLKEF